MPIRHLGQARHRVEVEERVVILDRADEDVEDRGPQCRIRVDLADQRTELGEPLRTNG